MDGEIAQRSGDEADKEMTRLWRTWRTVYEMLSDRVSFYS
jgi:DNA-directed RNA polymerase I, II, and III subunit RPABC1